MDRGARPSSQKVRHASLLAALVRRPRGGRGAVAALRLLAFLGPAERAQEDFALEGCGGVVRSSHDLRDGRGQALVEIASWELWTEQ